MKYPLLIACLLLMAPIRGSADPTDRDLHMIGGAAVATADYAALVVLMPDRGIDDEGNDYAALHSLLVCTSAGAAKEFLDEYQHRGRADPWDAAATFGGCVAGIGTLAAGQTLTVDVDLLGLSDGAVAQGWVEKVALAWDDGHSDAVTVTVTDPEEIIVEVA